MRSVITVFRILEEVADRQPVGVSDLARQLGLPKSTAQRGLGILHELGWIRADATETRRWSLTTKAFSLGAKARELDLRGLALPVMRELQDTTGENIHLAVTDGDWSVLIEKVDGSHSVRTFEQLGAIAPVHASATGKAILAHRPEVEVEAVIQRGLTGYSQHTITSPQALLAELAQIRNDGFSVNRGEWREDVTAIGAALRDTGGNAVAAISVSVPAHRLDPAQVPTLGRLVAKAAASVTLHP